MRPSPVGPSPVGAVVVAAVMIALTGCRGCDVVDDEPPIFAVPDEAVDVFVQSATARADILWVVDNSGSMAVEQKKLADRFNVFFRQLVISQVDYHIGVVTTDPADGGALRSYGGPAVDGCDGCAFLTRDVPCADDDVDVSALSSEADIEAALVEACPAQLVFRRLVQVGTGGSAFEQGFPQAAAALGAATVDEQTGRPTGEVPRENVGFLRADASLYVVFVSDADDGGDDAVRYYQRLFEGLKPAGEENNVAVAAITGWPLVDAPAPVGELCSILQSTYDVDRSNDGGDDDPRAAAVAETLRSGASCRDPEADDDDPNAVAVVGGRYIDLACRTGGVVANLCDGDYGAALDALGANAAGLQRKFAISTPDSLDGTDGRCAIFVGGADEPVVDCDGDGERGGANDAPLCVTARCIGDDVATLQPRGTAWTWEPATSSVRFGGACLPAPGSDVVVRYRVLPPGRTCR